MTIPLDATRLIQDVLAELGWSADASLIANGVRRLDLGLPAEDQFSVVCAWLGQCQLLHKLDQLQVPLVSRTNFQVPDLLAKFATQTTKPPVLIEVKSKQGKTLSFKPEYLQRLKNYADLLNLPLLIAWKYHSIWMIFEAHHLQRAKENFNINLDTAMRENLMGVLAGDVAYKIGAEAGVHLRFRKDKLIDRKATPAGFDEEWAMTVDDVSFTDYKGDIREDLESEVQSLFTAWDLSEHEEHSESHIKISFVAGAEGIQFAHMALVQLLNWESPRSQNPHWRALLRKDHVTANLPNFAAALDAAFRQKVVSHIFHVQPHTMPAFLS